MARHIPEVSASQRFRDMTRAEQSASIADAGARVDALNPKELVSKVERLDDLRKIEAIVDGMAGLEQRLAIAVRRANEAGRSWSEIARVLGVTKQSAHAKYVDWKLDPASLTPDSVIRVACAAAGVQPVQVPIANKVVAKKASTAKKAVKRAAPKARRTPAKGSAA